MQMPAALPLSVLENTTEFLPRHIGIDADDEAHMLSVIGEASRRALIDSIVPRSIARSHAMDIPTPASEAAALAELKAIASRNRVLKWCATSPACRLPTPPCSTKPRQRPRP